MVTGTGIWAFISPRRGVSGAHFGGLRILRTLCRIAVADGPGRPEFIARRFHTPIENAIYLLGTSATRPSSGTELPAYRVIIVPSVPIFQLSFLLMSSRILLALSRPDLCQPLTKFATNGKSTVMLRFPDLIEVHIFFLNYDLSNSG